MEASEQPRIVRVPQTFRLILASGSPRRRELLAMAGYVFTIEAADVDESQHAGEDASAYVRRLAEEKAQAVFARHRRTPRHWKPWPCWLHRVSPSSVIAASIGCLRSTQTWKAKCCPHR